MSVNKALLIGHLGADPETRTTNGGTVVSTLRLATTERVKDGDQWKDHTEWHRCVCFGRTAENVQRYLRKGRQVYIEGRIRTRKWTDKEGVEKYSTEIVVDTIHFLGRGDDAGSRDTSNHQPSGGTSADDDIPF